MNGAYYNRKGTTHIDGTPIFQSKEDRDAESSVAVKIASAYQCQIERFGMLSPVDWYAQRDGRLIGVLELKSRSHATCKYPTVFLNVRKWLSLCLAQAGLGVPAMFVVQFTDGLFWIPVSKVDATANKIGGCRQIVKSASDCEPVIEIPINSMTAMLL